MNSTYRSGFFVLGVIFFITITVLWSLSSRNTPELYPGDRIEERSCRVCGGSGGAIPIPDARPTPAVRCRDCGGDGLVRVLVPGPNRPTRIWGVIVEREKIGKDKDPRYYTPRNVRPNPELVKRNRVTPIEERIFEARATFSTSGGETIHVTTDENGRFAIDLPPGQYTVEMVAPGYKRYNIRRQLVVDELTDLIWFEESQMMPQIAMAEGVSDANARGIYGMTFIGGLSRFSSPRGFWRAGVSYAYY